VTRTIKLAERGAYFSKYTKAWGPVGLALNSGKMLGAGMADYNQYQKTGEVNLDNTIEAATEITVSWAGGLVGAKIGGEIGGVVGSWFGGAGAVPGGIIGCAAGGTLGAFCGPELFENIREKIEL